VAKVLRYLWRVTWRELQQAFLLARSHFQDSEARAQWRLWIDAQTGLSPGRLFLEEGKPVPNGVLQAFTAHTSALNSAMPIQQIIGFEYFDGLKIQINGHVLIPRPETQELVALAADRIPKDARVLDLGTGSGCIALALKNRRPDLSITGIDSSPLALKVAAQNAGILGLDLYFFEADLCDEPSDGLLADAILCNPPYISPEEYLEPEVVEFEPSLALYAPSGDSLFYYRRALAWARVLGANQIGFECHRDRVSDVAELAQLAGYQTQEMQDQFAAPRWVWAQKPGSQALPLKA
jgi:release factor glutamine methyltransferase